MKKCINCGHENEDEAELCAVCGSPLRSKEKFINENPKHEAFKNVLFSRAFLKFCIYTLIISVLAVVFFAFQMAMLGFEKSIFFDDLVLIVFFSVVLATTISLLIARVVLLVKRNKK